MWSSVFKSLGVFLVLTGLGAWLYHAIRKRKKVLTVCLGIILLAALLIGGDHLYPFERSVPFHLYAQVDLPEEDRIPNKGTYFWHTAYEAYGLYPGSRYCLPGRTTFGYEIPQLDLDAHTYVITYGQELEGLTYLVWETIDIPIPTGAKLGYAVLSQDFRNDRIYIYELPKLRIDNDP